MARGEELRLHGIGAQLAIKLEVRRNLRRGMHGQIPARESFEEALDLLDCGVTRFGFNALEERAFIRSVQAVAIQRAAKVVGSGNEKLPQHFCFPWC